MAASSSSSAAVPSDGGGIGHRSLRYLAQVRVYSSEPHNPDTPQQIKPTKFGRIPVAGGVAEKPLLVYCRRKRARASEEVSEAVCSPTEKKVGEYKYELPRLRSCDFAALAGRRTRRRGGASGTCNAEISAYGPRKRQRKDAAWAGKRWVELESENGHPHAFDGLRCKVYWSMDDNWYKGTIGRYDASTKQHCVEYDDGETEHLILCNEKIKFCISYGEMQRLGLKVGASSTENNMYNELVALAMSLYSGHQDIEPGDVVWAKLTGHAMWPSVVMDESNIHAQKVLKPTSDQHVVVQFFGSHDFARIKLKQAVPFLNGLISSQHLKCKKVRFYRSLEEAKEYLSTQQFSKGMLQQQRSIVNDTEMLPSDEDEDCESEDEAPLDKPGHNQRLPIKIGTLRVTNLGRIVSDSEHFHDKRHIWPEEYVAFREFTSFKDSQNHTVYKMEVLRNPKSQSRPLFRITSEDGQQAEGPSPSACWKDICSRYRKRHKNPKILENNFQKSGSYMFGFSSRQIRKLIENLPNSHLCSKYFDGSSELPIGYRAVHIDWKSLDRCSICDMDEEYEDNLFIQCDKCRMLVHARCYGELEPLDGVLWFCNLCRPGAPSVSPQCCLCPITGGAMKPTTDGRWAHLTCAIWIPETCFVDIKKMEPIDGLCRISKDRWKLLCSICGVAYGACIQCSHNTCRVAYHPLCARAAGLCVELEDEEKMFLLSIDDDDNQCIRLLSFCKKHRQPSNERPAVEDISTPSPCSVPSNKHPSNPTGCARTEPYNFTTRRGQKQPQILAAASVKRLYVENTPYIVRGRCQNGVGCDTKESVHKSMTSDTAQVESASVCTIAEKYKDMKATFRRRLAFGKSRIHGFGVFARVAHKAGDMVIEYVGELVRPPIADIRERRIYNSLVGAGTYMFRIDNERVIDATRSGSIAHLINHSCEPNCYSRMISVNSDEHIIIFAKRDINQWEELTYDYRFCSIDERLSCFCGFPRCRGVVNDIEAEEQRAQIRVAQSEILRLTK